MSTKLKAGALLIRTLQRIRWSVFGFMLLMFIVSFIVFGTIGLFVSAVLIGIPSLLALVTVNKQYARKLDATGETYDRSMIIGSKEWLDSKVPREVQVEYKTYRKWGLRTVITCILTVVLPGSIHGLSNDFAFYIASFMMLVTLAFAVVWVRTYTVYFKVKKKLTPVRKNILRRR